MNAKEIWDKAARSILPTKPIRHGYADCLHPKMLVALDKYGWKEAATRETAERVEALKAWCQRQGIIY